MNALNVFGLTLMALVLLFLLLRVERRALWLVLFLVVLPSILAFWPWAIVGGHLGEAGLALAIAPSLTAVWWLAFCLAMPRPNNDTTKDLRQEKLPNVKP